MTNLQIGSRGSDVAELQRKLNARGYALDVDGAFGSATAAAVRDYQARQGLTVDGIAGPRTLSALSGASAGGDTAFAPAGAWSTAGGALSGTSGIDAAAPAPYVSPYGEKLTALYDEIAARPGFTYDPQGDALYRHYRDRYAAQGRAAMADTLGQASALTGGYGSSYAQGAAQTAYRGYLQKLWDLLPTLQDKAYQRYKAEGDALQSRLKLLTDADAAAYQRYQGYLKQFNADRNYALKAHQQAVKEAAAEAKSTGKSASGSRSRSASKSASKSGSKSAAKTFSPAALLRNLRDEKRLAVR